MSVVNVIMRKRTEEHKGPSYVTICMKGHWDVSEDGIMITSGTWDATKFDIDDMEAGLFAEYLTEVHMLGYAYEVVPIDERHLSPIRHEYWSDPHVHCNFKNDYIFKGVNLLE